MKKNLLLATLVVLVPSLAMAHVSVRPRESKPGAEEQYTVRVPTEGAVVTTDVMLEIPADVAVLEVLPAEGATFETATAIASRRSRGGKRCRRRGLRSSPFVRGILPQWKSPRRRISATGAPLIRLIV